MGGECSVGMGTLMVGGSWQLNSKTNRCWDGDFMPEKGEIQN